MSTAERVGEGLVSALQRLAGFEEREAFRGVDPQGFEHLRCQDLPDAALEREAAVGMPAVRCLAGALRPEIQQPSTIVAKLRKEKAAAVADFRVVHAELMAVIAQRQRLCEVVGERLEAAKMCSALGLAQPVQPNARCPPIVEKAGHGLREVRWNDGIIKVRAERQNFEFGSIVGHGQSVFVRRLVPGKACKSWKT